MNGCSYVYDITFSIIVNIIYKNLPFRKINVFPSLRHSNIFSVFALIYSFTSDKLCSWGVTENGKRFAFRQSEYILRTSSIFGGGANGK